MPNVIEYLDSLENQEGFIFEEDIPEEFDDDDDDILEDYKQHQPDDDWERRAQQLVDILSIYVREKYNVPGSAKQVKIMSESFADLIVLGYISSMDLDPIFLDVLKKNTKNKIRFGTITINFYLFDEIIRKYTKSILNSYLQHEENRVMESIYSKEIENDALFVDIYCHTDFYTLKTKYFPNHFIKMVFLHDEWEIK